MQKWEEDRNVEQMNVKQRNVKVGRRKECKTDECKTEKCKTEKCKSKHLIMPIDMLELLAQTSALHKFCGEKSRRGAVTFTF